MTSRPLPPPPIVSIAGHRRHPASLLFPAAVAFPSALLLLLLLFLLHLLSRRSSPSSPLRCFSLRSLRSATLNFDPSRSLGCGSSAVVFHGILPDGESVAVKRHTGPHHPLLNELRILAAIPHSPFVVSLLGYSLQGRSLVFEYMPHGSLHHALFGPPPRRLLHWDLRYRIILDVARAIAFLHLECNPPVIHGDLKPANILLAADFQAKLADFGLSRRKADYNLPLPIPSPSTNHFNQDDERKGPPELRCSAQMETLFSQETAVEARSHVDRKMKEWWREEDHFAEIGKPGRRIGRSLNVNISFGKCVKKKMLRRRSQSVGTEIRHGNLHSKDVSSTTSMRGTACYTAPECGNCSYSFEKSDIYSFGVLVLVIVSGRRPLHVQESPMKLHRANLISWCRKLAKFGDAFELLDEKLRESCDKDQVNLCINLALLCVQRSPEFRPDSGDIVKILTGEMDLPVLPLESSSSPSCRAFNRSMRTREDEE